MHDLVTPLNTQHTAPYKRTLHDLHGYMICGGLQPRGLMPRRCPTLHAPSAAHHGVFVLALNLVMAMMDKIFM